MQWSDRGQTPTELNIINLINLYNCLRMKVLEEFWRQKSALAAC